MAQAMPFGEVLDAIDKLSIEDQETLVDIVHRRLAERERKRIAGDIREARHEFDQGRSHPNTVDEIMDEILS